MASQLSKWPLNLKFLPSIVKENQRTLEHHHNLNKNWIKLRNTIQGEVENPENPENLENPEKNLENPEKSPVNTGNTENSGDASVIFEGNHFYLCYIPVSYTHLRAH